MSIPEEPRGPAAPRPPGGAPRPTPFALALPGTAWCDDRFRAIAQEAEARGVDPGDPGAFLLLAQVGAALQDLRPEDAASPEALHSFGGFLFHAFRLLGPGAGGAPCLLEIRPGDTPGLVAGEVGVGGWDGRPPAGAGYLRLPTQRFWVRPGGADTTPEALDGVAWAVRGGDGAKAAPALHLLAVSGIVKGRPGFSVLPLPSVPLSEAPLWAEATARPEGEGADFEPTLPGGELAGFHSIETAGELLKLVARAFAAAGAAGSGDATEAGRAPGAGIDDRFRLHTLALDPEDPTHAP